MVYHALSMKKKQNSSKLDVFNLEKEQPTVGTSDEGLPQRLIDSIITNTFDRSSIRNEDRSKLECSICCTDFKDGDKIKYLQCLHTHHKSCIDEWFKKKSVCPDCKFNLRSIDMQQFL